MSTSPRVYRRIACPTCGDLIPANWYSRHIRARHPAEGWPAAPPPVPVVTAALTCSACGESRTTVIDTRPTSLGIRRRRECLACGARWTTREIVVGADAEDVELPSKADVAAALRLLQVALGIAEPYQATGILDTPESEVGG